MKAKYTVGIDLGTTNSVLAYSPLANDRPEVFVLRIPQLVASETVEARAMLPSFLYLGSEHEAGSGALDLPWAVERRFAVGELARAKAAEAPDRTVGAAKSWLCHSRVDRREPILPWNAPKSVGKISPVAAAQRYLEHLAAAWAAQFPDASLSEQRVVLAVPASFDAVARELTREAALNAGLPSELVLLEEPQAAVYAWLADAGDRWRKRLQVGHRLLVCDVGGGTTDLTLVGVAEENGDLFLQRLAVGNHLLVGGDNMDLALAHLTAERFGKQGIQLDPWQSVALWHSCRMAKESLLASGTSSGKHKISILGRGSKLIGKTVSLEVDRQELTALLLEGFFPPCGIKERPKRQRLSGFQEIGLPFETDTAVTRHVAAFLQDHPEDGRRAACPTHILFNGGVFKASVFRERLLEVLRSWWPKSPPPMVLDANPDLDHAVARGAAYYGWAKDRGGVRIRGGVGRSYYVGVERAGLAIPGALRPLRALCVVPFGMEEGSEVDVPSDEVGLVIGESAHFRLFSSAVRKQDRAGEVLETWSPDELSETDSLETTLPLDEAIADGYVPVRFQSRITELGVFELWCIGTKSEGRWKLEFSVRGNGED